MSLLGKVFHGVEKAVEGVVKEATHLAPLALEFTPLAPIAPVLTALDKKILPAIEFFDSEVDKHGL